jgi:hypothetical protein
VHVRNALAARGLIRVESGSVILNFQFDVREGRTKPHHYATSAHVPADIRQGLLRGAQDRFVDAGSE